MEKANNTKDFYIDLVRNMMNYFSCKKDFLEFMNNSQIYDLNEGDLSRYIKGERKINDSFIWYFCKTKNVKIESILPW